MTEPEIPQFKMARALASEYQIGDIVQDGGSVYRVRSLSSMGSRPLWESIRREEALKILSTPDPEGEIWDD